MRNFKNLLVEAEFVSFDHDVPGSRIYLPAGWSVRNHLLAAARDSLNQRGFQELHLPSIIRRSHVEQLDSLSPISGRYYSLTPELRLAATHEAAFFPFAEAWLKRNPHHLPFNAYHVGPAYRHPKASQSPFNFGERSSFLEVFSVCRPEDYQRFAALLVEWTRILTMDIMKLPSVQVVRPKHGNLGFSEETITVETILPVGRTLCTAMVYKQGGMFTQLFSDERKRFAQLKSTHAGITDNLYYAYLANAADDGGFTPHSTFAPSQVLISCSDHSGVCRALSESVRDKLRALELSDTFCLRSSRNAHKEHQRFLRQGIPILLLLEPKLSREGRVRVYSRDRPLEGVEIGLSEITIAKDMCTRYDQWVSTRLAQVGAAMVAHVRSVGEFEEALQSGKICSFYLRDCQEAVAEVDTMLPGGEVLGYELNPKDEGACILDGQATGRVCYAARRI